MKVPQRHPRRFATVALPLALMILPAMAEETAPVVVTTDSPAYCEQLSKRVETLRLEATTPPPQEVADLSEEGSRMCDNGLARSGVMRLRRALSIMMHPDADHVARER
jgi:hypothetical protein